MVKRRAIDKADELAIKDKLPVLYKALTPLAAERHSDLFIAENRNFQFAAQANAIPLTCDEFPQALQHYPIVIADSANPIPVALVGLKQGKNDFVMPDGSWKEGHYVPAYLRRYPFMLVRQSQSADRGILCADLSSTLFGHSKKDGNPLFNADATASKTLTTILEFCQRYDTAAARTRSVMKEAQDLGLIQKSTVNITRGETKARIEGFAMIAEDKLRDLPDEKLASLVKRGLQTIFAAHHLSMAKFSDFGGL
jgi:hypothetical protein